jgi:DNA-nicking Smr family endonuclease
MSGRRPLSEEERILWARVADSTTPLNGRRFVLLSQAGAPSSAAAAKADTEAVAVRPAPAPKPPQRNTVARASLHRLDPTTRRKLAKGRLPIEGRVDLHGLTQGEAHALLLAFLHRAFGDGRRHVLVITGKGSSLGSDGILRRAVPAWLATPPFRGLVGAIEDASASHGGGGALYVRLRRQGQGGAR